MILTELILRKHVPIAFVWIEAMAVLLIVTMPLIVLLSYLTEDTFWPLLISFLILSVICSYYGKIAKRRGSRW